MAFVAPVTDDLGTAVIDAECRGESLGVMACSAIGGGCQVIDRGRLTGRVDAIGIVMAAFTGQLRRVDQAVIEYPVETESRDAVAVAAIDDRRIDSRHRWMAGGRVADIIVGKCAMTGVASVSDHRRTAVVGESFLEAFRRMAVNAIGAGNRMGARGVVARVGRFAGGGSAVVATRASTGNTRMIKAAIRGQCKKAGGIVAAVTLAIGR